MFLLTAIAVSAFATPGEIVLDLRDDPSLETVQNVAIQGNISDIRAAADTSWDEGIFVGYSEDIQTSVQALANNPAVEAAEPNQVFTLQGSLISSTTDPASALSVNDPEYAKQWHMRAASSEYVWKHTKKGKGIVVAVLDTGFTMTKDFDPSHVDLKNAKSFIRGEAVADGHGHGSHCAGTIAQWTGNEFAVAGLAPEVTILPIKVLSNSGSGYIDGIAAGIDYATDQGADVISMSLGGGGYTEVMKNAMDRAMDAGVIVVAAAGNSGGPHNTWPAAYPPVISVGSTGPDGKWSPYSSHGSTLDIMAPGGNKSIPHGGVYQWVKFQGQESLQEWQGTSMATPHVAAAVAVLLAEGAPHKQAELEQVLLSTSRPPLDDSGKYGRGLMDLEAAVKKVQGSSPTPPPPAPGTGSLPWPNPAGHLTFVVTALTGLIMLALQRVYKFPAKFFIPAAVVAIASAGPLHALTYLPVTIPGLSFLMVPWLEIPEYLIGKGASGFPLWLSFVPLLTPFLVLLPLFPRVRPVIIGMLASTMSYLLVDTFAHFNPVWWLTSFGSSCWLGINSVLVAGMLFTSTELHHSHNKGGK